MFIVFRWERLALIARRSGRHMAHHQALRCRFEEDEVAASGRCHYRATTVQTWILGRHRFRCGRVVGKSEVAGNGVLGRVARAALRRHTFPSTRIDFKAD